MSKTITMSEDKKALLDALLKLTDDEFPVVMRFFRLHAMADAKEACMRYAAYVAERNTGLSVPELTAFCDKIEKELLGKVSIV